MAGKDCGGIIISFNHRFGSIPDLLELDHLTVSGDVTFGRGGDYQSFKILNGLSFVSTCQ